jgi:hypothetical protein
LAPANPSKRPLGRKKFSLPFGSERVDLQIGLVDGEVDLLGLGQNRDRYVNRWIATGDA